MSAYSRQEGVRRLAALLHVVEDELLEMTGSVTEQDLGWFIAEVSSRCRDAWDCRPDEEGELEDWDYWPVTECVSGESPIEG